METSTINVATVEAIAKVCHEANRAFCQNMGDMSQPSWEDAPDWQKDSAIKGVGFRLHNPNAGHDAMHLSWMQQKQEEGWVYGEVKDPEAKTHPCMVPFKELPIDEQMKDSLFSSIAESFIQKYGLRDGLPELPLTFGQKAVGLRFNPSNDDEVGIAKQLYADIIDQMNVLRLSSDSHETKRLASVAITQAQDAQMWAVKAITWKD